jgi:hypothetical protein
MFAGLVEHSSARDDGPYANSPLKPWFDGLRSHLGRCCWATDRFAIADSDPSDAGAISHRLLYRRIGDRRLPGEDKILADLRALTLDRIVRWRPIKNAIKLGGLKLAGAILELALEWQTLWKKKARARDRSAIPM